MDWKITDGMYYVEPLYGSDTNNGSKDAPFATMRRGMKAIYDAGNIAGSKLVFAGGYAYDDDIITSNLNGDGYDPALRKGIHFVCDGCKGVISNTEKIYFGSISGESGSIVRNDILDNFLVEYRSSYALVLDYYTNKHVLFKNCFLENMLISNQQLSSLTSFENCICLSIDSLDTSEFKLSFVDSIVIDITTTSTINITSISTYYKNTTNATLNVEGLCIYNAVPTGHPLENTLYALLDVDPLFVDAASNNFNLTASSPLLNAGKPNPATGKPTNIGGTYLSNSINGSDTSLTLTNVIVDADDSFILDGAASEGIIESGIIDLGTQKSIVKFDFNSNFDYDSNGIPTAFIDTTKTIAKGTAQSGSGTSVILSATEILNSNDDYYNGMFLKIVAGTGSGQMIQITDYVASTKTVTLASSLTTALDNTSQYIIIEGNRLSFDYEVKWSTSDPTLSDMTDYRKMEICGYLTYSDMINKYGNADPNYNHSERNYVSARYIQFKITLKRIE